MVLAKEPIHDSRVLREAGSLRHAGHEVSILAWDRTGRMPRRSDHQGLSIHRICTEGFLRALASDVLRNPIWWRRATRYARGLPFDVVHCHDLDTLPIGVRLKRVFGKPLVYDCHEIFRYMIKDDVPRVVADAAFRLERRLAPHADRVIAVTQEVKEYVDRISEKDAVVVRNCMNLVTEAYVPPPGPPFTVLYIGDLHPSRFVLEGIEVIGGMPETRLVVGGTKRLTPVVKAKCAEHPNTEFLGPVPADEVLPRTLQSHAVMAMLDPRHQSYQVALSNKIFEAMVTGRPSINTEGLPGARLVDREACGLSVTYSPDGFRRAVERLRDDPSFAERLGRNGLLAAIREYNWANEARKLLALYEDLEHSIRRGVSLTSA